MNNCVLYCRVSTLEQTDFGVSLDSQAEKLTAYAGMTGLTVAKLIREEGVSAKIPFAHRPGGREAQRLLHTGAAEHICAVKLDRMFRDTVDALTQSTVWDKAGVTMHILDLGGSMVNSASPMGRMMLTVIASLGELERSLIASRTADALAFKKSRREVYSPVPFGFRREGDRLVPDPEEMALVVRIRKMHAAGVSLNRIAGTLNEEGISGKTGGRWYATTVRKILANDLHSQ
jgi:DNA invertase Pin-like site-specific DNA recombinase